ncbi:Polycomb protein Su-like protein [Leptotrombidium deliense]|uniref:Polycomb protein Su-like protein n=1 Tax=Leptotrombidium deliense TaxID=299467 RepID=A0A443STK6_9ACAR|nr:Polycomb protein Su-like protein [Leptotrombidium deliense]
MSKTTKNRKRSLDSCSSITDFVVDKEVPIKEHNKELLMQAFEKPTQIYRYLRSRHAYSPIFLTRTLSYMKHRMSRKHGSRKDFHVESLERKIRERAEGDSLQRQQNLVISLKCFVPNNCRPASEKNSVVVDITLQKVCHKKRKDTIAPVTPIHIAKREIPYSTPENVHFETVVINKDHFNNQSKNLVKTYSLLFTATVKTSEPLECVTEANESNELFSLKKRKIETVGCYKAELTVFDRNQRCLLEDGEYELILHECSKSVNGSHFVRNKFTKWETIANTEDDLKEVGPQLMFDLAWSSINGYTQPSKALLVDANNENSSLVSNTAHIGMLNKNESYLSLRSEGKLSVEKKEKKRTRVVYQFVYNNIILQQTKASSDLRCPWCSVACMYINPLMKHLQNCHSRFKFHYTTESKGCRIDVSINELFDGSYGGNPQDMSHSTTGYAFSRNGPVRRQVVTEVFVYKTKKVAQSSTDFIDNDDVDTSVRPLVAGHNRLYYHTNTCMPISAEEMDEDSEAENDPEWLRIKTQLMIDEFTDVNEGEKEVMKLWNLHVMKYGFVGDCQIGVACNKFVDNNWREIQSRNLYNNFVTHLSNLYDFGLLSATIMRSTIRRYNQLCARNQFSEHKDMLQSNDLKHETTRNKC